MAHETDQLISFSPHAPSGEGLTFTEIINQLPPEALDMTGLIDAMYLLTTPLFGLLFAAMVFFLRRILKQFDKAVDKLEILTEKSIKNETILNTHIVDDRIHDFSRRQSDGL